MFGLGVINSWLTALHTYHYPSVRDRYKRLSDCVKVEVEGRGLRNGMTTMVSDELVVDDVFFKMDITYCSGATVLVEVGKHLILLLFRVPGRLSTAVVGALRSKIWTRLRAR